MKVVPARDNLFLYLLVKDTKNSYAVKALIQIPLFMEFVNSYNQRVRQ